VGVWAVLVGTGVVGMAFGVWKFRRWTVAG